MELAGELNRSKLGRRGIPWSTLPAVERFNMQWRKIDTGCHEWMGAGTKGGYGVFNLNGRQSTAHRAAYVLFVGEIPDGYQIDHLCRNRRCVNVEHLEAVTPYENTARGTNPFFAVAASDHCLHGHEFTAENTYITPTGRRRCRECLRSYELKRRR